MGDLKKTEDLPFYVIPASPDLKKNYTAKGTHNKLEIDVKEHGYIYGSWPMLQIYKNGKWTDVGEPGKLSTGKDNGNTVTGLKPNTKYKFRMVGCEPASENTDNKELRGKPSNEITVTTASNELPQVKSVKVLRAKNVYNKGYWAKGYWDSLGGWNPAKWVEPFWTTEITVQVTLKKSVPGSKRIDLWLAAGKGTVKETAKGKLTLTASATLTGKLKSGTAKIQLQSFADKDGQICGPKTKWKNVKFTVK